MFFAQLTGAEVYTIEKNSEMVETAVKNIESLGYAEKINVFEGDGEEIAELLKKEGTKPFDVVFIDGVLQVLFDKKPLPKVF